MKTMNVIERPILYSTPMIRAKLEGRKTQTRRLRGLENVNDHQGRPLRLIGDSRSCDHPRPAIKYDDRIWFWWTEGNGTWDKLVAVRCPYKPGDVLWARETLIQNGELGLEYFANREPIDESLIPNDYGPYGGSYSFRNIPNIHMPKWASRIWERITDIRVERLQDITEADAIAEGVVKFPEGYIFESYTFDGVCTSAIASYHTLWESINGAGSWDLSPWVWVITTEILSTTGRPKELDKITVTEME
jgi:hypothetical protein